MSARSSYVMVTSGKMLCLIMIFTFLFLIFAKLILSSYLFSLGQVSTTLHYWLPMNMCNCKSYSFQNRATVLFRPSVSQIDYFSWRDEWPKKFLLIYGE
jgi:hypothetical protein